MRIKKIAISLVLIAALTIGPIACGRRHVPPQTYTPPPPQTQPVTPTPTPTTHAPPSPQPVSYPWNDMNMFFGWNIMGLLEKTTEQKRPAYYTYKIMREKLRDFTVGNVSDLSVGNIRIFEFITPKGKVYVVWNRDGGQGSSPTDLSDVLGNKEVTVIQIVTELNANGSPIRPEVKIYDTTAIPLSITPVFIA